MTKSKIQFVECRLLQCMTVTVICHWSLMFLIGMDCLKACLSFFACEIVYMGWLLAPSHVHRSCLQQDCPGLPAVGWVPRYFEGKDCCVKTTCHLLVKMFWILNDESLISPAVPSAARANLPFGLYQGIRWKNLSWSFVLCKFMSLKSHLTRVMTRNGGKELPLHFHEVGRRHSSEPAWHSLHGPSRTKPASAGLSWGSGGGSTFSCRCFLARGPMLIARGVAPQRLLVKWVTEVCSLAMRQAKPPRSQKFWQSALANLKRNDF